MLDLKTYYCLNTPLQSPGVGITKQCPPRGPYSIAGLLSPCAFTLALIPATPMRCMVTWLLASTKRENPPLSFPCLHSPGKM